MLVRGESEVASWPLDPSGPHDLSLVDALARMQLAAKRMGCAIRLRNACAELSGLLDLVGLGDVVGLAEGPSSEAGWEAERLEQVGVEEVVVSDDPVA